MGSEGHLKAAVCPQPPRWLAKGSLPFVLIRTFPVRKKPEFRVFFELLGTCVEINENMMTDFSALIGAGAPPMFSR